MSCRYRRPWLTIVLAALLASGCTRPAPGAPSAADANEVNPRLFRYPAVLDLAEGALHVEAGEIFVPEHHARPGGRTLSLPFYRLSATRRAGGGTATFMLAGGPGEALLDEFGTDATLRRIVAELRASGDVVLFDQRGAGRARPRLDCTQRISWPTDQAATVGAFVAQLRAQSSACRQIWLDRGVDLQAYNTAASVADIDALRRALGYERINMLGHSYGTHLALAYLRAQRDRVARVILQGVEGPDDTYDLPSQVFGALGMIADEAQHDTKFAAAMPTGGLLEALAIVQERLTRQPVSVKVRWQDADRTVVIGAFDVQRLARRGVSDRADLYWPALLLEMYRGEFERAATLILEDRAWPIDSAMYAMMDCASGLSPARRSRLRDDPLERKAAQLLGNVNLMYEATCDVWQSPDLGDAFRAGIQSDVPLLILQGTWDASTPSANAETLVRGFPNGKLIRVKRGSHFVLWDLVDADIDVLSVLNRFLAGDAANLPDAFELPAAQFVIPR